MSFSGIFGRIVAIVGAGMILMRRWGATPYQPAVGTAPVVPEAMPQGIPTLKMPTAKGWAQGQTPIAAEGLKVNAFAAGLSHPRWIHVLPNGDVLTAEARSTPGGIRTAFDYAIYSTMKRAAAVGESPNRITLLRDLDGDGVAEVRHVFKDGLNQPFGMAMQGSTFYIGNTDGLYQIPYIEGADALSGTPERLAPFKPNGHWTRSILTSPDGTKLYIGIGSDTNIADNGMELEEGRAAIWEMIVPVARPAFSPAVCATQ